MRKFVLNLFFILSVSFATAQEFSTEDAETLAEVWKKTGQTDLAGFADTIYATTMPNSILADFLTQDSDGTLYMYSWKWTPIFNMSNGVFIYKEKSKMTRSEIESYVQKNDPKVLDDIEGKGYRKYGSSIIRTPKGNFYEMELLTEFYGVDASYKSLLGEKLYYFTFDSLKKRFVRNPKLDDLGFNDGGSNDTPTPSPLSEGSVLRCNDNLRLRSQSSTSSSVVTSMKKGTRVRIVEIGRSDTSEGVRSNWVMVEVLEGGVDKNGVPIQGGTRGWCFGGFLE